MVIKKSINIKATPEALWDVLTNPKITQQYMYGCAVVSEWVIGCPIYWNGKTEQGEDITYVKGHIQSVDAPKQVQFTMFDPNVGLDDIPENYVSLKYDLQKLEDNTVLFSLEQGDYSTVENSQKRYEESLQGWDYVLPILKELAEKQ